MRLHQTHYRNIADNLILLCCNSQNSIRQINETLEQVALAQALFRDLNHCYRVNFDNPEDLKNAIYKQKDGRIKTCLENEGDRFIHRVHAIQADIRTQKKILDDEAMHTLLATWHIEREINNHLSDIDYNIFDWHEALNRPDDETIKQCVMNLFQAENLFDALITIPTALPICQNIRDLAVTTAKQWLVKRINIKFSLISPFSSYDELKQALAAKMIDSKTISIFKDTEHEALLTKCINDCPSADKELADLKKTISHIKEKYLITRFNQIFNTTFRHIDNCIKYINLSTEISAEIYQKNKNKLKAFVDHIKNSSTSQDLYTKMKKFIHEQALLCALNDHVIFDKRVASLEFFLMSLTHANVKLKRIIGHPDNAPYLIQFVRNIEDPDLLELINPALNAIIDEYMLFGLSNTFDLHFNNARDFINDVTINPFLIKKVFVQEKFYGFITFLQSILMEYPNQTTGVNVIVSCANAWLITNINQNFDHNFLTINDFNDHLCSGLDELIFLTNLFEYHIHFFKQNIEKTKSKISSTYAQEKYLTDIKKLIRAVHENYYAGAFNFYASTNCKTLSDCNNHMKNNKKEWLPYYKDNRYGFLVWANNLQESLLSEEFYPLAQHEFKLAERLTEINTLLNKNHSIDSQPDHKILVTSFDNFIHDLLFKESDIFKLIQKNGIALDVINYLEDNDFCDESQADLKTALKNLKKTSWHRVPDTQQTHSEETDRKLCESLLTHFSIRPENTLENTLERIIFNIKNGTPTEQYVTDNRSLLHWLAGLSRINASPKTIRNLTMLLTDLRYHRDQDGNTAEMLLDYGDPFRIIKILDEHRPVRNTEQMNSLHDFLECFKSPFGNTSVCEQFMLLEGPPGTGKTTTVTEYLMNQCSDQVDIHEWVAGSPEDKYLGQLEVRIQDFFKKAHSQAKSSNKLQVLFIDEIDTVCPEVEGPVMNEGVDKNKFVSLFQTELTRIKGTSVVLLGTTNHPERISKPILNRAGKNRLIFPLPTEAERHSLLTHELRRCVIQPDQIRQLARLTAQWSPRVIMDVVRTLIESESALESHVIREAFITVSKQFEASFNQDHPCVTLHLPTYTENEISNPLANCSAAPENVVKCFQQMLMFLRSSAPFKEADVSRHILLYGVPGGGKTYAIKQLLTKSNLPFLVVDGLISLTEMKKIFSYAAGLQPALIFIDEIDVFFKVPAMAAFFQTQMDGFNQSRVSLIAATNFPDQIPDAVFDRFTIRLEVPPLSSQTRRDFIMTTIWASLDPTYGLTVSPCLMDELLTGCHHFNAVAGDLNLRNLSAILKIGIGDILNAARQSKQSAELTMADVMTMIQSAAQQRKSALDGRFRNSFSESSHPSSQFFYASNNKETHNQQRNRKRPHESISPERGP